MGVGHYLSAMKTVNAKGIVKIPEGVEVTVKSRNVVVKGKRGTLTKSFRHMSVDLYKPDENTVAVEKWFAKSKELSVIKTCCSHIQNMIDGVTKGFQYRMKMVYAHFPTNVQIATNGQSLDIVNFIECHRRDAELRIVKQESAASTGIFSGKSGFDGTN